VSDTLYGFISMREFIKRRFTLTLTLVFLFTNHVYAEGRILEKKTLPKLPESWRNMELFVDRDNVVFIQVDGLLYVNNNSIKTGQYGRLLNGFLKDGHFQMAFEKDGNIDVYNVQKNFQPACRIKIIDTPNRLWGEADFEKIFAVPEKDTYILQGECDKWPTNPFDFIFCFTSGGHGISYRKPFLAEVQGNKMLRYIKFHYGGKQDESFRIQEAVAGKEAIHFVGFRRQEEPSMGPRGYLPQPEILHYADYNLKKNKTVRTQGLFEHIDHYDKNTDTFFEYGPLSIDCRGDDVYVVFSCREEGRWQERSQPNQEFNIKDIKSNIFYWQFHNNASGSIEKVGEGFSPVVKVDYAGNVHVFWVNSDGVFFHTTRKDGKWSQTDDLSGIDIRPEIAYWKQSFSVAFDQDNHVYLIFPSRDNLVCVKVKAN
jgi:hypothetical protein